MLPCSRYAGPRRLTGGPDGGLGNNRATGDTHPDAPEGLAPSREGVKATRRNRALLSSRAIPALPPRRRMCAKLPGCRDPDVAARRGQGSADPQVRPQPR